MVLNVIYQPVPMEAIRVADVLNTYRAMRGEPINSWHGGKVMTKKEFPEWLLSSIEKTDIIIHRDSVEKATKGKYLSLVYDEDYIVHEGGKVVLYTDEEFHKRFSRVR